MEVNKDNLNEEHGAIEVEGVRDVHDIRVDMIATDCHMHYEIMHWGLFICTNTLTQMWIMSTIEKMILHLFQNMRKVFKKWRSRNTSLGKKKQKSSNVSGLNSCCEYIMTRQERKEEGRYRIDTLRKG